MFGITLPTPSITDSNLRMTPRRSSSTSTLMYHLVRFALAATWSFASLEKWKASCGDCFHSWSSTCWSFGGGSIRWCSSGALEEALDLKARAVSFSDNTASIAIMAGRQESERTYVAPKRFKEIGFFATFLELNLQQILEPKFCRLRSSKVTRDWWECFGKWWKERWERIEWSFVKGWEGQEGTESDQFGCPDAIAKGQNDGQIQLWQPSFHCKLSVIHPVDHHSFSLSSWFLRSDCWLELYLPGLPFIRTSAESHWLSQERMWFRDRAFFSIQYHLKIDTEKT